MICIVRHRNLCTRIGRTPKPTQPKAARYGSSYLLRSTEVDKQELQPWLSSLAPWSDSPSRGQLGPLKRDSSPSSVGLVSDIVRYHSVALMSFSRRLPAFGKPNGIAY